MTSINQSYVFNVTPGFVCSVLRTDWIIFTIQQQQKKRDKESVIQYKNRDD